MNLFSFIGDSFHLLSSFILLHTINSSHSVYGISFKTQALYCMVFLTRYIDIFFNYVSLYIFLMKLFFLGSSSYIVYIMITKYLALKFNNGQPNPDSFKVEYLILGSFVMALLTTRPYSIFNVFWTFSIWLESVAIFPQLFMLQSTGEAELLTTHYIFALGLYRAFYIPNWIWRYYLENRFDIVAVTAGIIQTVIYSDFFYIYYQKVMKAVNTKLPV